MTDKNELLFQHGINYNETPLWQRRGIGFRWQTYPKQGHNPITNETVAVARRRLEIIRDLPMKDDYRQLIAELADANVDKPHP